MYGKPAFGQQPLVSPWGTCARGQGHPSVAVAQPGREQQDTAASEGQQLQVDMAEHPHSQPKGSGFLEITDEGSWAPWQMSHRGKNGTRMFFLTGFLGEKVQRTKSRR